MNSYGLAAPNQIRCQRAASTRPAGGSLRLRGLVVDKVCAHCGGDLPVRSDRHIPIPVQKYCSRACCHEAFRSRQSLEDRFWPKVDQSGGPDSCWPWLNRRKDGYGMFSRDRVTQVRAHRVAYELVVGPIPAGLTLDHLCVVRHCVNPAHLEPVTAIENVVRGHARRRARA
jgi:hypothetical protein